MEELKYPIGKFKYGGAPTPAQRTSFIDTIDATPENLRRAVAGLSESVQVLAATPIVDVKTNSVTATISKDVIALLPTGRNFLEAIIGVAGTGLEGRGGGLMIDGAGASENRYLVDGLDTTNLRTGVAAVGVIVDFIEQIQVKQSGYNAEFRASTGGVVSAIRYSSFSGATGTEEASCIS